MSTRSLLPLAVILLGSIASGCHDTTAPRDSTPPVSPRQVISVTGDHTVYLHWIANTEKDLAFYYVYEAPCFDGDGCPYDPIGTTTGTSFTVTGLTNGVTRFFAVSAVDLSGNESKLSKDEVFDTPRPEGFGRTIANYLTSPNTAGYDFSAGLARPFDDASTDMFYGYRVDGSGVVHSQMFVPYDTDIQDAGFASSLDAIDFAPSAGWSPSGTVEAIPGHCYVVWTRDDHYAKFRVTAAGAGQITFDWAFQVDPGNRELRARPVRSEGSGPRPIVWLPA